MKERYGCVDDFIGRYPCHRPDEKINKVPFLIPFYIAEKEYS
jgi:hypothetical protein